MFECAIRSSLLHLSRRDLVSRFQAGFLSSSATSVLRPSCIEHSLKRAGEKTSSVTSHCAHLQARFSRDLAPIPCWVFLEMQSTSTQDLSMALLSWKPCDATVPELAGWIPTLVDHVLNTHARSHKRIDRNVSTPARTSLNRIRITLNKNFLQFWEGLRAFTLLILLGSSLAIVFPFGSNTSFISCF